MTPDQVATYAISVMQSTADEQTSHLTINQSVEFLDKCAKATIKALKEMRYDISISEPWG